MAHLALPAPITGSSSSSTTRPERHRSRSSRATSVRPTSCLVVADLPGSTSACATPESCTFFSAPVEVDTGANRGGLALYLRDPDGIILELFQPPRAPEMARDTRPRSHRPDDPANRDDPDPCRSPGVPRQRLPMTHRSTIVTRVHTEEGSSARRTRRRGLHAGRDRPDRPRRDRARLAGEDALASSAAGSSRARRRSTSCATAGSGSSPCACVDTAIWDAVGKALGQPLWRLWGGYRRSVPMIAIGGYYGTEQTIADEIAELRGLGSRG